MVAIADLLSQIETEEIRLPEFQRDFEWKNDDFKKLMESLYK